MQQQQQQINQSINKFWRMKKHRKELLELAAVFGLISKQEIGSNMHFVIPDRIDGKCNQLQLSALACNRKLAKNLSSLHYGDRN